MSYRSILILSVLSLFGLKNLNAQNPFEISLTGVQTDTLQKGLVALDDGGFVTKEIISDPNNIDYQILISRFDACLGVKWVKIISSKKYSPPLYGIINNPVFLPSSSKIIKANGNGFLVVYSNMVYSDKDSLEDCFVAKLDSAGTLLWSTRIQSGKKYNNIIALTCANANGNGYVIAGLSDSLYRNNFNLLHSVTRPFVVRLSENGNLMFSRRYYYNSFRQMSRILTFSNTSFLILFPGDESQIMKCDSMGNVIWAKQDNDYNSFTKTSSDFDINDAVAGKNDCIYCNGNYNNQFPGLLKMDNNWNLIWEYSYTNPAYKTNNCLSMILTEDKKIVMSNIGTFTSGGTKTTFIETDSNGILLSAKTVPDIRLNAYYKSYQIADLVLDALADSGFAFIGVSKNKQSLIVKADKYGRIGCNEEVITVDTASHQSIFNSLDVRAFDGYLVKNEAILVSNASNKATMVCSNHYYPVANLGADQIICNGSSYPLDAGTYNTGFHFLWSTGDTSYSIVVHKTGKYWLRVSHDYCSSSDTVNLYFKNQANAKLPRDKFICPYDSVLLHDSTVIFPCYWVTPKKNIIKGESMFARDSGYYYLMMANNNTCPGLDTVHISYNPVPKGTAGPDTLLCVDQEYIMKGSGGTFYQWLPDIYLSSGTDPNAKVRLQNYRNYALIISNKQGCRDTSHVTLSVRPKLEVKANLLADSVCYGQETKLFAVALGGDSLHYNYSWPYDNDTNKLISIVAVKSSWHKVNLYNANCSPDVVSDSIYLNVIPEAKAAFVFHPANPVILKLPVNFVNKSQNAINWLWAFDNLDSSHIKSPSYIFKDTGIYKVTLIAYGLNGCQNDTTSGTIKVIDGTVKIYIPNIFTPNGDGHNDSFDIKGIGIKDYTYSIYNRWGELIFVANSTGQRSPSGDLGVWDGTFKGAQVPEGVYIYMVTVTDIFDEKHYLSGNVTVVR